MASIVYTAEKQGESEIVSLFREILNDDGTVLARTEVELSEVRDKSPETLVQYFNMLADQLQTTASYFRDLTPEALDSDTYKTVGECFVSLRVFVDIFDRNLLPPDAQNR